MTPNVTNERSERVREVLMWLSLFSNEEQAGFLARLNDVADPNPENRAAFKEHPKPAPL